MAGPLVNTSWEGAGAQMLETGLVVFEFYKADYMALVRKSVLRLVLGPEMVASAKVPQSMFYNGVLSHPSAFHGPHRCIAMKVYKTVAEKLFAHMERPSVCARRLEMLPFQVHCRENSVKTLNAWSFTKTPGTHENDDVYLACMNLNDFNLYLDVVPASHKVKHWDQPLTVHSFTTDPLVVTALESHVFLPNSIRATMDSQKQTVLVPPGHLVFYSSKLVVKEVRVNQVDARSPNMYLSFAYRLTHSRFPLHRGILDDLKSQRPPMLHTGQRPVMYPVGDPFRRPDVYRQWLGTAKQPRALRRSFLVEWPSADGFNVWMPARVMEGLADTDAAHPPYTEEERECFMPTYPPLVCEWDDLFWGDDDGMMVPMSPMPAATETN